MPFYTRTQEESLRELRILFGEEGYVVFSLKCPKHELEFVAVKPRERGGTASCAVSRMYRGRVRVQVFHGFTVMFGMCKKIKTCMPESEVFVSGRLFNPPRYGNFRSWDDLAKKSEIKKVV